MAKRSRTFGGGVQNVPRVIPGCDIYGLTDGDFSLIDLIEHCLPAEACDVVLGVWTAAAQDIERALTWPHQMRFIFDRGLLQFKQDAAAVVQSRIPSASVRYLHTHIKFALIKHGNARYVLRTSMNLNKNDKSESYSITDSPALYDHFEALVDEIFSGPEITETKSLFGGVQHEPNSIDYHGAIKNAEANDQIEYA